MSDLCRRVGIKPYSYYSWTKEFMEAGKDRLTRGRLRDATRQEVHLLKRENGELGLLLLGHRHGRLLTLHPGPQASEVYDIRLLHRGGPGGRGQDRHGPGADRRPDQAPEWQRLRLCIPGLQGHLGVAGVKSILATSFHPQTNSQLERYHQTLKRDVNQLPYDMPSGLEAVIVAFVSPYDYRCYHKALGNVTPSDTLRGRRENILRRTTEVQAQTIKQRRRHNRALREMARP